MKSQPTTRIKHLADLVQIAGFIAACAAPLVCSLLGWGQRDQHAEKREARPLPVIEASVRTLKKFPTRFEAYYNDRFGLRDVLVSLNAQLRVRLLGVSTSPHVVLGRAGWLFYDGDNAMDDHRGRCQWSDDDLCRIQRSLEARRDWLAARGCEYLFVVAPNKESVYPEYLPPCLPHGRTCLDQLVEHLTAHSDLRVLDLRSALAAQKADEPLYLRTDSHWNDLGAYTAYRAVLAALPFQARPRPEDDFEPIRHSYDDGDLAGLLGLHGGLTESIISLRAKQPRRAVVAGAKVHLTSECPKGELPATIMLRDSFASALVPFLSEHFERMDYLWQQELPVELIERQRPRLVIQQIVERSLWSQEFCSPPPTEPHAKR